MHWILCLLVMPCCFSQTGMMQSFPMKEWGHATQLVPVILRFFSLFQSRQKWLKWFFSFLLFPNLLPTCWAWAVTLPGFVSRQSCFHQHLRCCLVHSSCISLKFIANSPWYLLLENQCSHYKLLNLMQCCALRLSSQTMHHWKFLRSISRMKRFTWVMSDGTVIIYPSFLVFKNPPKHYSNFCMACDRELNAYVVFWLILYWNLVR